MSKESSLKKKFLSLMVKNTKSGQFLSVNSFYGFVTIGSDDSSEKIHIFLFDFPKFFDHCLKITKFFALERFEKIKSTEVFTFKDYKINYELNKVNDEKIVTFFKENASNEKMSLFILNMEDFANLLKAFEFSILSSLDLSLTQKFLIEKLLLDEEFKSFKDNNDLLFKKIIFYTELYSLSKKDTACTTEIFLFYFDIFEVLTKLKKLPRS